MGLSESIVLVGKPLEETSTTTLLTLHLTLIQQAFPTQDQAEHSTAYALQVTLTKRTDDWDYDCIRCMDIMDHCSSCTYHGGSNSYRCDLCDSEDYMLAPDGYSCIPKLADCAVDWSNQPAGLIVNGNAYDCPFCREGAYHDSSTDECKPCHFAIENCELCPTANRCTKCSGGLIPNYLQTGCQAPIEYCKTKPDFYLNDGTDYICEHCIDGFYADGGECVKCPVIAGCSVCETETTCKRCVDG